jgi:hypothetical protein
MAARKTKPVSESEHGDSGKIPKTFRLTPETVRKLELASESYGMAQTAYVELSLQERFKKDKIE